jgi:uncharacterized membrane protein
MEPSLLVALGQLLFSGTHIGLATGRIRGALVERLGVWGFNGLFSAVAAVTFSLWVHLYVRHRFEGLAGPGLAGSPGFHAIAMVAITIGIALMLASLAAYPSSPMALFSERVRQPRGIERITRHGFFVGVALLGLAHALLAAQLVGTVFFGGLALHALLGSHHQDRKLLAQRGDAYAEYLAATSLLPFVAILRGRQRLVWSELPLGAILLGVALSFGLRAVHEGIPAHGGFWVIAVVLGGAAIATLQTWRRAQRTPAPLLD